MSIDVRTIDSPGWWLKRCSDKLVVTRKRIDPLFARYEGNAPLPSSMRDAPDSARRFFRTSRTNLAEMLVKAPRYKLRVTGILTGSSAEDASDDAAFELWRRAGMHTEQHDVHRNALVSGNGYILASRYEGEPAATSEDPRQIVTIHDPVRQASIRAAAKFFNDADLERDVAYLFRPETATSGRRWVAVRSRRSTAGGAPRFGGAGWDWDPALGGAVGEPVPVPMPVVRYRNEEGVGEFERHVDHLDRFDHLTLQGMVIATLQAFKQRAIKVDPKDMPDRDPDTGEEIDYSEMFLADPGALWKLPETAEMWESGAVDLTPLVTMQTKELERISAVTFTPMSMFSADAANQSATGATLVKEGLTNKVEDKQGRFGEEHAHTVALLGQIADEPTLQDAAKIRIRWAPAQRYSLAEMADAGPKAMQAGMPWRTRMRVVFQMEPEDIERMESERLADQLLVGVAAQTPAAQAATAARPAARVEPAEPVEG